VLPVFQKYEREARTVTVAFAKLNGTDDSLNALNVAVATDDSALTAAVVAVGETTARVRIGGGVAGGRYVVTTTSGPTARGNLLETRLAVEVLGP
jgi:hypothetical protein